jgi:hypothetical protein
MEAANSSALQPLGAARAVAGTPCLARFSQDGTIYRAVVLKRDGQLAKVYYLDYGNSESLPLASVFSLPAGQQTSQMLSVRCSVHQWPPGLGEAERASAKTKMDSYLSETLNCR